VAPNRVRQSWSPEAYALARQARSLNFLKIEPLIQKLQQASGRSRRDCLVLIRSRSVVWVALARIPGRSSSEFLPSVHAWLLQGYSQKTDHT